MRGGEGGGRRQLGRQGTGRRQEAGRWQETARTVAGGGQEGMARKVVGWPWGLYTPLHPLFT